LNWKYSLLEILAAYFVLIAGAFLSMVALTAWAKYRANDDTLEFAGTSLLSTARFGSTRANRVPP
jgi:hypothetical protein